MAIVQERWDRECGLFKTTLLQMLIPSKPFWWKKRKNNGPEVLLEYFSDSTEISNFYFSLLFAI